MSNNLVTGDETLQCSICKKLFTYSKIYQQRFDMVTLNCHKQFDVVLNIDARHHVGVGSALPWYVKRYNK